MGLAVDDVREEKFMSMDWDGYWRHARHRHTH